MKTKIIQAYHRIKNYLPPTPLIFAQQLSLLTHINIYLKLENLQPTGSFKVRGAFNKLLSLSSDEKKRGVIAASTGNHGAAVAYASKKLEIACLVCVPTVASSLKVNNIRSYGAEVQFHGNECLEAERYARDYAHKNNMIYLSPYNDTEVIHGQGTIGYELAEQLEAIHTVFASVGGGGLIVGTSGYLKSLLTTIQFIGCMPENSPVMVECIKAGKIIEIETQPTLSDATAGNMDADSITFPLYQKYIDENILVSEAEIKAALCLFLEKEHLLVEGASAVSLAGLLKVQKNLQKKNVVIIVSGANISLETLKKVIQ